MHDVEKEAVMPLFVTLNHKVLKHLDMIKPLHTGLRHIINYKVLKRLFIIDLA